MSRKGWEKLEQKLEHAGTAGNDLLNFGLVSISTFHTYSMRFVVFWVILLWRWQSPNCWIWWLVCFGWGFVVWLASQNTTSVIGSQRLANFMASNCTLMSRGGFVSTPEISSMLPANSPCLNAWEEQCMHVTILHQTWNMLCCTCMLHIWTQLNRRMTCLLHLDKNLVANIQSVNVWSLNTCLILWMQAHTVVYWETFNSLPDQLGKWNPAIKELVSAGESRQSDTGTPAPAPLRSWTVCGRTCCCDILWLALHLITLNAI